MCPKVLYIQYNESDAGSGGKHSSHCRHKNSSHVAFYIRICFSRRMLALGMLLTLYSSVSLLPRDAELPPGQPPSAWFQKRHTFHPLYKTLLLSCSSLHIAQCVSDCIGLFFLFLHLGPWLIEHVLDSRLFFNRKTGSGPTTALHSALCIHCIYKHRVVLQKSVSLLLRFPGLSPSSCKLSPRKLLCPEKLLCVIWYLRTTCALMDHL